MDTTRYAGWRQLLKDLNARHIKVMTYCNPCLALVFLCFHTDLITINTILATIFERLKTPFILRPMLMFQLSKKTKEHLEL